MKKNKTVQVGSKECPIQIYWNIPKKKKRVDDFLMVLSITSGAYGDENLDEEVFKENAKAFFRYAKEDSGYYNQLAYVLENSYQKCSDFLNNLIKEKWNLYFDFNYRADKWATA